MATLEERFFQRNVPNRFSSWAEDEEGDERSLAASEQEEEEPDDDNASEADGGEVKAAAGAFGDDDEEIMKYRWGPNTGPKGVLADHRAHQRAAYVRAQQATVSG